MKMLVGSTDLAIINRNYETGIIKVLDTKNDRIIRRKITYVGSPAIPVIVYQGYYQFVCNMGSVSRGAIRY